MLALVFGFFSALIQDMFAFVRATRQASGSPRDNAGEPPPPSRPGRKRGLGVFSGPDRELWAWFFRGAELTPASEQFQVPRRCSALQASLDPYRWQCQG